jgi:hypothetical protein
VKEWLEYLQQSPNLATWAQSLGVTITGIVALIAAILAYRGAIRQAKAVQEQNKIALEIFEKKELKEANAAAMALVAEMQYWIVVMVSVWRQAQQKNTNALYRLSKRNVKFQMFETNPRALVSVDPLTVADIVAFYASLEEHIEILKDRFEHIKKDKENDGNFKSVIETTRLMIAMGHRAVVKLQRETGLSYYDLTPDVATAIKEALEQE